MPARQAKPFPKTAEQLKILLQCSKTRWHTEYACLGLGCRIWDLVCCPASLASSEDRESAVRRCKIVSSCTARTWRQQLL